jgi:hypothetical protein
VGLFLQQEHTMRKISAILMITACFAILISVAAAQANEEPLELDFNRDFGYGGFGGDIQGRFSLKVRAPEDIVRVEYYLDGERVYEGSEPPFRWQFNTASFSEGQHTFTAVGYKADGTVVKSEPFTRVFLSPDSAWEKTTGMIVPILVVVAVAALGGVVLPLIISRNKEHVPGVYGAAGGSVCPRCQFPFSRSMMAPNLVVGKLVRCPHCGKWAVLPRASAEALRAAEARLAADSETSVDTARREEEKFAQMLEESRFDD